jgi:hypothetical protein
VGTALLDAGRNTRNRVPLPNVESTAMWPSWFRTIE